MSKNCPIKQASLMNSARSLTERRAEPLGNLNKCHTVRTSLGLPFNASYACTSMHEFGTSLFYHFSHNQSIPHGGHSH